MKVMGLTARWEQTLKEVSTFEFRSEIDEHGTPVTYGKCQALRHQGARESSVVSKKNGLHKCGFCYFS